MKKKIKNIFIGAALLASVGLFSNTTYIPTIDAAKKDYVKIHDVDYYELRVLARTEGTPIQLTVDVEGYDNEGWKETRYYLDGELAGTVRPPTLYVNKEPKCGDTKEIIRHADKFVYEVKPNLKQGKHTLKAILEDCEGNTIEDSYVFDVKGPYGTVEID